MVLEDLKDMSAPKIAEKLYPSPVAYKRPAATRRIQVLRKYYAEHHQLLIGMLCDVILSAQSQAAKSEGLDLDEGDILNILTAPAWGDVLHGVLKATGRCEE
jgi:hypothetical protein